ncbi:hypothetical protein Drorol1_Dr00018144 [Drosera rotundifolia]
MDPISSASVLPDNEEIYFRAVAGLHMPGSELMPGRGACWGEGHAGERSASGSRAAHGRLAGEHGVARVCRGASCVVGRALALLHRAGELLLKLGRVPSRRALADLPRSSFLSWAEKKKTKARHQYA